MWTASSLRPFSERAGVDPAPGPVSAVGQEGEAGLPLNRTRAVTVTRHGVATRYLVRGGAAIRPHGEWLRADDLGHCPEKAAEYDAAAPRRRAAHRGDSGTVTAAVPAPAARASTGVPVPVPPPAGPAPLVSPAGFRRRPYYRAALATKVRSRSGQALVGHRLLYRWPAEECVRGRPGRAVRVRVSPSRTAGPPGRRASRMF
jgi:hypothetical protein